MRHKSTKICELGTGKSVPEAVGQRKGGCGQAGRKTTISIKFLKTLEPARRRDSPCQLSSPFISSRFPLVQFMCHSFPGS